MKHLLGRIIIKSDIKKYIKINRNQLQILEALLIDGGNTKKYIDKQKNLRYSEHSGNLDFNNNKLDRIIVSAQTNREDTDDIEILLPEDLHDSYTYKYFFHTHPLTPTILDRVKDGILYDFPSIPDIFHFIDHYNMGTTIGSIVIATEGYYIIYPNNFSLKKIDYDIDIENEIMNKLDKGLDDIQVKAINKYSNNFNEDYYYSTIIIDKTYLNMYNKLINKYLNNQIKIVLHNRVKDKLSNKWIVKSLNLLI
jgi:hypothetical protein